MSLLKFLGFGTEEPQDRATEASVDTIRRIIHHLEEMDPARARHLAAFSFILSRVANADREVSDAERQQMEYSVMTWGHLPEDQAVLVVQIAIHQNTLFGGTDNFVITREFNENATREQKEELLHCLFAVSAADDSISSVEESAIAQVARELGFSHSEHVGIRNAYRDKRAVLKDMPGKGN